MRSALPNASLSSYFRQMHSTQTGVLLAIGGTFLFAMKSIFIKLAFATGAQPTDLLLMRMLLSAPFYIGMLLYLRRSRSKQPSAPSEASAAAKPTLNSGKSIGTALLLGFLGYYLASLLDLSGLQYISAQLERLTLFTYPTMIAVLAWIFLGEKLRPQIVLGLVLCYLGVCLMYIQESQQAGGTQVMLGVVLVLGSALSYSVYVVSAKPLIEQVGSREFTSWAMLGSALFILIHCLLAQTPLVPIFSNGDLWFYGFLIAFVCTVIPSFLINESIARIGATRTSIIGSVGPVMTMLLAIFCLQEPSSLWHLAGMLVVIAGVACVSRMK